MGFPPMGRGRRAGGSRHRVRRGLLSVQVPVSQPPASDRGVMSDTRRAKATLINDTVLEGRNLEKILRGGREVRDCDIPAAMTYRRKIPTHSGTRIQTRGHASLSGRASRPFRAVPGQIPPGSYRPAGCASQLSRRLHAGPSMFNFQPRGVRLEPQPSLAALPIPQTGHPRSSLPRRSRRSGRRDNRHQADCRSGMGRADVPVGVLVTAPAICHEFL